MSRSGYCDDFSDETAGLSRGPVVRAIKGARGQAALKELASALDAMPNKILAADQLISADGEYCTLGILGLARGLEMKALDPEDADAIGKAFNIAPALAREIVFENDEVVRTFEFQEIEICGPMRSHSHYDRFKTVNVDLPKMAVMQARWSHMRNWVAFNTCPATNVAAAS